MRDAAVTIGVIGLIGALTLSPVRAAGGETEEACVAWAKEDVKAALRSADVAWEQAQIAVGLAPGKETPAEGFKLTVEGDSVRVAAGDAAGAMYGLLELAEQIRNGGGHGSWPKVVQTLSATEQRPFIELRADNPFCHTGGNRDKDHPYISFNDLEMWKSYLDMLARNRFNAVDIHGTYGFGGGFGNIYPVLVHVPEYPQVGRKESQDKALADFKAVVAHAKRRGIRVGLMSYSVGAAGLAGDVLTDYTAKAVARLCREIPDLYMIGFRIGESGGEGKSGFFEKAYLPAGANTRLYTRTWGASPKAIDAMGNALGGRFDIQIKYNGEELGLPYHAAGGIYGYEGYLRLNPPYRIIWQIRGSGDHRFWAWENTDHVRRTIPTFQLGGAVSRGFSLEPHVAYTTPRPRLCYKEPKDQDVYRYAWERHWMWYLAWGRLGYNPDLPETTIVAAFKARFGQAGQAIYQAMQESGKIVPLVLAANSQSIDHSWYLPELETGCFRLDVRQILPDERKDASKLDPLLFGKHPRLLDRRSYAGISQFVAGKIAGKTDGRIGPAWVVRLLGDWANNTRQAVAQAGELTGRPADEWRLLKTDLLAAVHLGDYHAARTLGVMHLDYALQTASQPDYDKAVGFLKQSRDAWKTLSEHVEAVYAPLYSSVRVPRGYHWSMQLPWLEALDALVPGLWEKVQAKPDAKPLVITPAERGAETGIRVDRLAHRLAKAQTTDKVQTKDKTLCLAAITCRAVADQPIETVLLWHKPLSPCDGPWQSAAMKRGPGDEFSAEVPVGAGGLIYGVEVRDAAGQVRLFPDPLVARPYQVIELEEVARQMSE